MTPFVLVGLTAVAGFYSPFLTLALLFLVWVSMLYHIMLFFRRRRQGALAGPPADSSEGGEIPTIHSE